MKRKTRVGLFRGIALALSFAVAVSATAFASGGKFRQDTDTNYLKYINGFEDNTVRPDGVLTRAQGAKMLYYVLDLDAAEPGGSFVDVPESFWGYQAISALSAQGIINGYSGNAFKPDSALTRAEFSAILTRAMGIDTAGKKNTSLKDVSGHWAEGSIAALTQLGFIGGYGDGTFRPNASLTRAEAVKLINKAVNMKVDKTETRSAFADLPANHWAFYEIMAAASSTALEVAEPAGKVKFSEIEYMSLSQTDLDAEIQELVEGFDAAETSAERAQAYNDFLKLQIELATAITMTALNVERDVSNEKYKADYESLSKAENAIEECAIAQYNALKNADDRDEICRILGIDFASISEPQDTMGEELVAMAAEEAKYENEFNEFYNSQVISHGGAMHSVSQAIYTGDAELYNKGLDYLLKNEAKMGGIFDNLVKVRTRMAEYYGFEDYRQLAYYVYNYQPENIEAFRSDVKQYLVPLLARIRYAGAVPEDSDLEFPDTAFLQNSEKTIDAVKEIMRDLSPQTRQVLDYMVEYEMFDLEARANKTSRAFSMMLGKYQAPFMFMSEEGGFVDVKTFSHEFGHSLQFYRTKSNNTPLDVSEVASTSLELMMTNNYGEIFGENAEDAEQYHIYEMLYTIVDACMMDEFQSIIYQSPDMTPEMRNNVYLDLMSEYIGTYTSAAHEALRKGIVWSNAAHIYNQPFYMIQYALANAVSLQIWELSKTDFDAAFETYMNMVETRYSGFGIGAAAYSSGLDSPFAEDTMLSIAQMIERLFTKDTARKAA